MSERQTRAWWYQRRTPEWRSKRKEILDRAGDTCECCQRPFGPRSENRNPTVHHGYYHAGNATWEHPNETLWGICWHCHQRQQPLLTEIVALIGSVNPRHYDQLLEHVYAAVGPFGPRMTAEQVEREKQIILQQIRDEEVLPYTEYYVIINASGANSWANVLGRHAEESYPGIHVEVQEGGGPDGSVSVSGPDPEVVEEIEASLDTGGAPPRGYGG